MVEQKQIRSVLVTGASTGIGWATALHLEKLGYQVFGTVRKDSDANRLSAESQGNITPLRMDVTDAASIRRSKDEIHRLVGSKGLYGLVNNAGVGIAGPLEFLPMDLLRWEFEVNTFGLLSVTRAFLPLVRAAQGRIVNVSSIASQVVAPFHGSYSASKAAVNAFNDALRMEVSPFGVAVVLLIVGSVHTPIWEKARDIYIDMPEALRAEALRLYGKRFGGLISYFQLLGAQGSPPESVARTIARALNARRPKHTYFAGKQALANAVMSRILFGRMRDRFICEVIGI